MGQPGRGTMVDRADYTNAEEPFSAARCSGGGDTAPMLLVVDGNNVAWAGFHALRKPMRADTPEKKVRAGLLGLTQSVLGFAVRAGEPPTGRPGGQAGLFDEPRQRVSRLVIAFDEGRPLRRRAIFPPYQTGRESDPSFMENEKHVLEAVASFIELARSLPVTILRGTNTEADDLIAAVIQQSADVPARIASTDKDFLQLVDERVSIYSPVKRLVVTTENFTEATAPRGSDDQPVAFPRERYLDYRVASGDASDNLPGIPGVGNLTAARLLAAAPLDAYFDDPAKASAVLGRRNARLEAALAGTEGREAVERNRNLMDLRAAALNYSDLGPYSQHGTWDEPTFRAWVADQRIAGLEVEPSVACLEYIAEEH